MKCFLTNFGFMRLILKILILLFFRVDRGWTVLRRKEIILSAPAEEWNYSEKGIDWKGIVMNNFLLCLVIKFNHHFLSVTEGKINHL